MYKKFQKMGYFRHIIFALIAGFAIVAFWRGVWGLLDIYLLPANAALSMWVSVAIGVIILIVTHDVVKGLT